MDNEQIVNRLIDILNSQNSNLLIGNITSPRPGSICQVSTKYGIKSAFNLNCTYPGNAIVVWDKDEKQYYCFTNNPSTVLSSRQLSYRKNRETPKKKVKAQVAILYYIKTNNTYSFYVGGCFKTPVKVYEYTTTNIFVTFKGYINLLDNNKYIVGLKIKEISSTICITLDSNNNVDSFTDIGVGSNELVIWNGFGIWSNNFTNITSTGGELTPGSKNVYFRYYLNKANSFVVPTIVNGGINYSLIFFKKDGTYNLSPILRSMGSTKEINSSTIELTIKHLISSINYETTAISTNSPLGSSFSAARQQWGLLTTFGNFTANLFYNYTESNSGNTFNLFLSKNNTVTNVTNLFTLYSFTNAIGLNAISIDRIIFINYDPFQGLNIQDLKTKTNTEVSIFKYRNNDIEEVKTEVITYYAIPNQCTVLNVSGLI